jgi:dihydrofolate reductase
MPAIGPRIRRAIGLGRLAVRLRLPSTVPLTQYFLAQSLDGYLAESDGGLRWLTEFPGVSGMPEDAETPLDAFDEFFEGVGSVAMGSATYEFLLEHSPGKWPYEGRPTWVFTTRELANPFDPGIRFVSGPVEPFHREMVEAAGDRNVYLVGGGDLASQFVDAGLLDELIVTIVPVVLGDGLPTFASRMEPGRLHTTATRAFANGMVELRCRLES